STGGRWPVAPAGPVLPLRGPGPSPAAREKVARRADEGRPTTPTPDKCAGRQLDSPPRSFAFQFVDQLLHLVDLAPLRRDDLVGQGPNARIPDLRPFAGED